MYAHYLHLDLYPASASETWPISHVRAGLDDREEVHHVKNLGGWSDVIGCGMGSSSTPVYTTTEIFFQWRTSSTDEKVAWLTPWRHFLRGELF